MNLWTWLAEPIGRVPGVRWAQSDQWGGSVDKVLRRANKMFRMSAHRHLTDIVKTGLETFPAMSGVKLKLLIF